MNDANEQTRPADEGRLEATVRPLFARDQAGDTRCVLCGKECPHGIARENHARGHERRGQARIRGFGGPSGRRYECAA